MAPSQSSNSLLELHPSSFIQNPKSSFVNQLPKVALHRRGSSQCGAKKKPKNCETVFSWSVLSHLIGLLS